MKKLSKIYIVLMLILGCLGINVKRVNAEDNNDYEKLVDLIVEKSGLPYYVIENDINDYSLNTNQSKEVVARLLLEEVEAAIVVNHTTNSTRASGSGSTQLDQSIRGDIWYSDVSTSGWNHGHVGLYETESSIVEARGPLYILTSRSVSKIKAEEGDLILAVSSTKNGTNRMSYSIRTDVVEWAQSKKGKGYLLSTNNKNCGDNNYNCSQLVYCAFKNAGPLIDLDSNGGTFVAPIDIVNSPYTYIIKSY